MTKTEFTRKYKALTESEKADLKAYFEDVYKNCHFIGTFDEAERRLGWIREIEAVKNPA